MARNPTRKWLARMKLARWMPLLVRRKLEMERSLLVQMWMPVRKRWARVHQTKTRTLVPPRR